MARPCTICMHSKRPEIDAELVRGTVYREMVRRYGITRSSISRHKEHLAETTKKAVQNIEKKSIETIEFVKNKELANGLLILQELQGVFRRINLLFDACDRWLQDPDNPEQYDVGVRSDDIRVIHTPPGGQGAKKEKLSVLLARLEDASYVIHSWESKHADPRELVLKTAANLQSQLELVAKLTGLLDTKTQINIMVLPDWIALRDRIVTALLPYPQARDAVITAIGTGGAE